MLVSVADDLAQIAGQVLTGERQGAARQLGGAGLALGWEPGGGDIPAQAGGGGGGGGSGSCRGGQGCGAGSPAQGFQWLGCGWGRGRLVEEVVVVMRRRRVVQGSGATVLDRLSWTRLERLLQLGHVVGILDTRTESHTKTDEKSQLAQKL